MTDQEIMKALARVREYLSDQLRCGRSMIKLTDVLTDAGRIETALLTRVGVDK